MSHAPTPVQPVLLGMRLALHAIVAGLAIFVIVRAMLSPDETASWSIALAIVLLASYGAGAFLLSTTTTHTVRRIWLGVVTLEILGITLLTPDGAFLVFPLFFLQLHLLSPPIAVGAILTTVLIAILELTRHGGWSIGGIVGPLVGAGIAIVIGLGYRALYREMRERQSLIDELQRTRIQLARSERDAGILSERSRLAREIHDTVAQGLSSIQLLLHAAERDGDGGAALESIRLARQTAADNLAETRRFIAELAPHELDGTGLAGALTRLADSTSTSTSTSTSKEELTVAFTENGDPLSLPMPLEATLLRIAQASLANAVQHADASRVELTLTWLGDWVGLDIVDNGKGFLPSAAKAKGRFGLRTLRGRVLELGGEFAIETAPGEGTAIAVSFPLEAAP